MLWEVEIRTKNSNKKHLFITPNEPIVMIKKVKYKESRLNYFIVDDSVNKKDKK